MKHTRQDYLMRDILALIKQRAVIYDDPKKGEQSSEYRRLTMQIEQKKKEASKLGAH